MARAFWLSSDCTALNQITAAIGRGLDSAFVRKLAANLVDWFSTCWKVIDQGGDPLASLAVLTDPDAVRAAIAEFRAKGRAAFLAAYGFDQARDYFVHVDGDLFDSKPLVAAAIAVEHPNRSALGPKDFSGGSVGAVRALERLGFEVVTRAQLSPPVLGSEFADRTAVYEQFGGDKVAGIIRLPGEDIINAFSDATGPYSDDLPSMTDAFGYRGEGLNGPQRVNSGGNALLERAAASGEAVRFWFRPRGGQFAFVGWAAVLGRSWVAGTGADKVPRPEIAWRIQLVASRNPDEWPSDVVEARLDAQAAVGEGDSESNVPEALEAPSYAALLARVEDQGQSLRTSGIVRTNYARSSAARRAVLVRSNGVCESPRCTGMPAALNRRGDPILDVDHIQDLALGGLDHPLNMVAICPNCHAVKTRGSDVTRYRRELTAIAMAAHNALIGSS